VSTKPQGRGLDFRAVILQLGIFAFGLGIVAGLAGYFFKGSPGLWGALIGAGITLVFFGTSALMMALGKKGGPDTQVRYLIISWFGKLIVLFALMFALNGATFVNKPVMGMTILVGVFGSLLLEGRIVMSARIAPGD
jgi:hypothetical protein